MPDIATMTFHWVDNYGAVLQAYSLQRYLQLSDYSTEIINYIPARVKRNSTISLLLHGDFSPLTDPLCFSSFRKNELNVSRQKYHRFQDLKKCADRYKMIICGSDQIWNRSFTCCAENGPTLSYFLGFAGEQTARIAYAVSFGADQMPEEYLKIATPEVEKFQAISVREKTGVSIAKMLGANAEIVCDPTLLLEKKDYAELIAGKYYKKQKVFSYLLHKGQKTAHSVSQYVCRHYAENDISPKKKCSLYEWLYQIANASVVVTNSFHGVMLSLIMNTPFIVIPVEGKNMNNRIETILSEVGLENRMVEVFDPEKIDALLADSIDWENVNLRLAAFSEKGKCFLKANLERFA